MSNEQIPSFLQSLYEGGDPRDLAIFEGLEYLGPAIFPHAEDCLVARVPKTPPDGDGADVEIYEARYACRAFRVIVHPYRDSVGRPKPGYEISTGSGDEMGRLAVAIAKAISEGMLGVRLAKAPKADTINHDGVIAHTSLRIANPDRKTNFNFCPICKDWFENLSSSEA